MNKKIKILITIIVCIILAIFFYPKNCRYESKNPTMEGISKCIDCSCLGIKYSPYLTRRTIYCFGIPILCNESECGEYSRNVTVIGIVRKVETPSDKNVPYHYNLILDRESAKWEAEELKYIDAPNIEKFVGTKVKVVVDIRIHEGGHIVHTIKTHSIEPYSY